MTAAPEIVLGITGSIGAYKAGDLVRHLRDAGYAVTCVMTQRATKFIAPLTLQALSERKVYTDLFDHGDTHIVHTTLADHARLVLVAPATANILAKYASGLSDDLLSCILLATRAKLLFAPAMNVHMWQHPTVQRNVQLLKRLGARFVGPDVGKLACGYEAIGHLAEPEEILHAVKQLVPVHGGGPAQAARPAAAGPAPRRTPAKPARRSARKR
jgi:phosphopantothenoylcysteine decarboxylase/phosphopantothenate--cysteine ligase